MNDKAEVFTQKIGNQNMYLGINKHQLFFDIIGSEYLTQMNELKKSRQLFFCMAA